MILLADVDLDLLLELNQFGGVRNLKDRRKDIYSLTKVSKALMHKMRCINFITNIYLQQIISDGNDTTLIDCIFSENCITN